MVVNSGGKKTKGKARKNFRKPKIFNSEELKKIEGQEYAFVTKKFGDNRYNLLCYDKVNRLGILRGTLKRGAKLDIHNVVLVSKRGFQDDKCDIIAIYTKEEVDKLISFGEILPSFAKDGKMTTTEISDDMIQLGDSEDVELVHYEHDLNDDIIENDEDNLDGIDIDDI